MPAKVPTWLPVKTFVFFRRWWVGVSKTFFSFRRYRWLTTGVKVFSSRAKRGWAEKLFLSGKSLTGHTSEIRYLVSLAQAQDYDFSRWPVKLRGTQKVSTSWQCAYSETQLNRPRYV